MLGRMMRAAPFAALSLLTLVLAHNLVFVVGYGAAYREVLSRTGHGDPWQTAVLVVLGLGLGLALAASVRIAALRREARSLAREPLGPIAQPPFLPGLLSLWLRLALSGAGLFTIQENLERLGTAGNGALGNLPGVAVLGAGGHPDALVVIAAVAAAVALVGQLFRWHRAVLIARLAAARVRLPRASANVARPFEHVGPRPNSILGRRLAVRAPPLA
jgi:hypothetical protein